jgi:uncharacterized protein (DUF2345 family)
VCNGFRRRIRFGVNTDQVAQQHVQLMSGQRFNATAGQGMQLFARGAGIQAVAGEGPMLLQAQSDALTANAQKGVKIGMNENEVLITAPTIRLVAMERAAGDQNRAGRQLHLHRRCA